MDANQFDLGLLDRSRLTPIADKWNPARKLAVQMDADLRMSAIFMKRTAHFPFRWVLPIAQLVLCGMLLWPWKVAPMSFNNLKYFCFAAMFLWASPRLLSRRNTISN